MLLAEGARMSSAMTDGFSFHYLFVYCIGPRRVKHRRNETRPRREEGHFLFLASTISSTDSRKSGFQLLARVTRRLGFLDILDDPTQVVGCRLLQWRVLYVRLKVLQPQLLTDGQHIPVVLKRGHGGGERTA